MQISGCSFQLVELIPRLQRNQIKKKEISGGTPCKIPVVIFSQWICSHFEQWRSPLKRFGCRLQITYIFVNLVMTHKWLGSLRGEKYLLLTIVWSNCWEKDRVLLTVHSHTDHYVVAFFLIYWWPASGRVHYCSSARDLISSSLPISGCIPYQSFNLQNLYQRKGNSWISRESKYSVGEFFTEVYST